MITGAAKMDADLLKKHDYDPEKSAFIRGSAISYIQDINPELGEKSIEQLLKAMDEKIEISGRAVDKPFYMAIESTYGVAGRGAVACGTVEQGDKKPVAGDKKTSTTATTTPSKTDSKSPAKTPPSPAGKSPAPPAGKPTSPPPAAGKTPPPPPAAGKTPPPPPTAGKTPPPPPAGKTPPPPAAKTPPPPPPAGKTPPPPSGKIPPPPPPKKK
ncbi:unnamed protein product [Sphagnum balticum]